MTFSGRKSTLEKKNRVWHRGKGNSHGMTDLQRDLKLHLKNILFSISIAWENERSILGKILNHRYFTSHVFHFESFIAFIACLLILSICDNKYKLQHGIEQN